VPANRQKVIPFFHCGTGEDGSKLVRFGYENPNAFDVGIPLGDQNHFDPVPADRGQPVVFTPGKHENVILLKGTPSSSKLTWTLDGASSTASHDDGGCN
jgi:hypothetical protein